ncbi:MAG: hypothetical protein AAGG07_14220 [Planctomycetota bacterium]
MRLLHIAALIAACGSASAQVTNDIDLRLELMPTAGTAGVIGGEPVQWNLWVRGNNSHDGLALLVVDLANAPTNSPDIAFAQGERPAPLANFDSPIGFVNLSGVTPIDDPTASQSLFGGRVGLDARKLRDVGGAQNTLGFTVFDGSPVGPEVLRGTTITTGVGKDANEDLYVSGEFLAPLAPGTYSICIERPVATVLVSTFGLTPVVRPAVIGLDQHCVEFEVVCTPDLDGNGVVDVEDMYEYYSLGTVDVNCDGIIDSEDIGFIESIARAGELEDMTNGRR